MLNMELLTVDEVRAMKYGSQTIDVGRLLDTALVLLENRSLVFRTPLRILRIDMWRHGYTRGTVSDIDKPNPGDVCDKCGGHVSAEGWYKVSGGKSLYRAIIYCPVCQQGEEF